MKNILSKARVASFLALLFIFINSALVLALHDFFIMSAKFQVFQLISMFSYLGNFLGFLLCPIFLPVPGRKKPLLPSLVFLILLILPNIILRSLGVHVFTDTLPVLAIVTLLSGMLFPLCYGFFFLTHLTDDAAKGNDKRLSRYCVFFFTIPIAVFYLLRFLTLPLMQITNLIADPLRGMSLVYNTIIFFILGIGGAALVCVLHLNKLPSSHRPTPDTNKKLQAEPIKTNWSIIFTLIGLSIVYRFLTVTMDLRIFLTLNIPPVGDTHPFMVIMGVAVLFIAFFAGRYTDGVIKWFLPPAIAMFIFLPGMPLFTDNPHITLFMYTLMCFFVILSWVFFTAELVEAYKGTFWFYGIATSTYFTNFFSFIINRINRFIPPFSTEINVLIGGIVAVTFFFLSYRMLVPKIQNERIHSGRTITVEKYPALSLKTILRNHGLSEREMEVASLIVQEGLDNEEIANRIFRSIGTVKAHVTNIYQKFKVKSRAEFIALFVRLDQ